MEKWKKPSEHPRASDDTSTKTGKSDMNQENKWKIFTPAVQPLSFIYCLQGRAEWPNCRRTRCRNSAIQHKPLSHYYWLGG
jgi:hypothetical protein